MIWGIGKNFAADLSAVQGTDSLLGFNEPDHKNQQSILTSSVVSVWPQLSASARRVGSPAAARALGPWMQDFYKQAEKNNLKIDFIAVHWYGKPDAKRFLRFLQRVYESYKKPLWITEFAVADWEAARKGMKNRYSVSLVKEFMREVLPELEKLDYVERYAWFGIPCKYKDAIGHSMFFSSDGALTELGIFYATY